jgi:branched-chain amino acid transport system substrate-binding protein
VTRGRLGRWWAVSLVGALTSAACVGSGTSGTPSSPAPDPFGSIVVPDGAPIRVGALLAANGDPGASGIDSLRGVEMAIDYLDGVFDGAPGRLSGHDIVLASTEDHCTTTSGSGGAEALAQVPGLVGVIGTTCSTSAPGATDALSAEGVLLISPTNADPTLTDPAVHRDFYLRVAVNATLEGRAAADFAADGLDASTAATIREGDDAAGGPADAFRTRFEDGDRVVVSSEVVDGEAATRRALGRLGGAPPDVVYLSLDGEARTCAAIAREAADTRGLADTAVLVSGGCVDAATAAIPGDAVLGGAYVVAPDLSPRSTDDFYRSEVLPAYKEQYGGDPPSPAFAYAFDAASILLDAVARAGEERDGGLTIPRSALREVAFGTDAYTGLTGTLTCTDAGDCASEVRIGVFRVPSVPVSALDPVRPPADPVYTVTVAVADLAEP